MSKRKPITAPGMVQLTLPLSSLASQSRKAGSLRCKEGVKEALRSALANCGLSREIVADELSRLTGESVSIHHINNWAAAGKTDRSVPLDMLAALTIVTGDPGPARVALERGGLVVLEPDQVPYFELGRITAEDRERAKRKKEIMEQIR